LADQLRWPGLSMIDRCKKDHQLTKANARVIVHSVTGTPLVEIAFAPKGLDFNDVLVGEAA
jgi:hypothetical protein